MLTSVMKESRYSTKDEGQDTLEIMHHHYSFRIGCCDINEKLKLFVRT